MLISTTAAANRSLSTVVYIVVVAIESSANRALLQYFSSYEANSRVGDEKIIFLHRCRSRSHLDMS